MPPHTLAIEDEPFASVMSETIRSVYGKHRFIWQHCFDGPAGKHPVSHFAPAGTAEVADLANRVVWEVVMEQKAPLELSLFQVIDVLFIYLGTECC